MNQLFNTEFMRATCIFFLWFNFIGLVAILFAFNPNILPMIYLAVGIPMSGIISSVLWHVKIL